MLNDIKSQIGDKIMKHFIFFIIAVIPFVVFTGCRVLSESIETETEKTNQNVNSQSQNGTVTTSAKYVLTLNVYEQLGDGQPELKDINKYTSATGEVSFEYELKDRVYISEQTVPDPTVTVNNQSSYTIPDALIDTETRTIKITDVVATTCVKTYKQYEKYITHFNDVSNEITDDTSMVVSDRITLTQDSDYDIIVVYSNEIEESSDKTITYTYNETTRKNMKPLSAVCASKGWTLFTGSPSAQDHTEVYKIYCSDYPDGVLVYQWAVKTGSKTTNVWTQANDNPPPNKEILPSYFIERTTNRKTYSEVLSL